MFKVKMWASLLVLGMTFRNGYAENDLQSALQETQACLTHQNCAAASTDAGKAADQQALEAVAGNARNKQALYDIAADMMPMLEQQAGGDPIKMQAMILKAQADPTRFLNALPPAIQAKIKQVADAVEKSQGSGQQP